MATSFEGPGAVRVAEGTIILNADRTEAERITLVVDEHRRPARADRLPPAPARTPTPPSTSTARPPRGFRLDVPSGTSQRFEPGASRAVAAVALRGRRLVPGIQVGKASADVAERGTDG